MCIRVGCQCVSTAYDCCHWQGSGHQSSSSPVRPVAFGSPPLVITGKVIALVYIGITSIYICLLAGIMGCLSCIFYSSSISALNEKSVKKEKYKSMVALSPPPGSPYPHSPSFPWPRKVGSCRLQHLSNILNHSRGYNYIVWQSLPFQR